MHGLARGAEAPRNWGKNVTLLSSITLQGVGHYLAVEGVTPINFEIAASLRGKR
jgi:hypothetical protein